MAFVLYSSGQKIGEISDWIYTERPPVYKDVLGQRVLISTTVKTCSFTSPKPIRRGVFSVIEDQKTEFVIQTTKLSHGTQVQGIITETLRRSKP